MALLRVKLGLEGSGKMPLYTPNYPLPYTWATKPAATIGTGVTIFVTDVGINGSIWISNGTTWKPASPVILHRLLNTTTTSNGTAEELIALSSLIPAGVLAIGQTLTCNFLLTKSATTESTSNALKIGTNIDGITGASAISSSISLSTTNRQVAFTQLNVIISATQVQQGVIGGSAIPYGITTSSTFAARTIPNISNAMYVSITGTKTTGGIETISCPFFEVILT